MLKRKESQPLCQLISYEALHVTLHIIKCTLPSVDKVPLKERIYGFTFSGDMHCSCLIWPEFVLNFTCIHVYNRTVQNCVRGKFSKILLDAAWAAAPMTTNSKKVGKIIWLIITIERV